MAKLTLTDVANLLGSPTTAATVINLNCDLIEQKIENTLSRDGTAPNAMLANIDMNGYNLLNVNEIDVDSITIDGVNLSDAINETLEARDQAQESAAQAAAYVLLITPANFATAAQGVKADTALQPGTSADNIVDGSTNKVYTAVEKTKLNGIATGATANSPDATLLARANHTGTQSADTVVDGTTNKAFTATEKTKLTGIATSATANPVISGTFTPVVTSQTGTLGSVGTCTGTYTVRDGICHFQIAIGAITVGTGSNSLRATLPVIARSGVETANVIGKEPTASAKMQCGFISPGSTFVQFANYDNTSPIAAGATFTLTGDYFV